MSSLKESSGLSPFRARLRKLVRPALWSSVFMAVGIGAIVCWHYWEAISERFWSYDGRIIVSSPSVYTRQRLVNDRLLQTAWLKTQLDVTKNNVDSASFEVINEFFDRSSERQFGNRGGSNAEGAEDAKQPKEDRVRALTETPGVRPTTPDLFRAKNTYREEVRAEMMETQLDDRHDIHGNTIYRLAFDATVLAGTRNDSLALIKVTLEHGVKHQVPRFLLETYDSDYTQLYNDWLRYMQSVVEGSLNTVAESLLSERPEPRLRLTFSQFLVSRVCNLLKHRRLDYEERLEESCTARAGSDAYLQASKLVENYINEHRNLRRDTFRARFNYELKKKEGVKQPIGELTLSAAFRYARRVCNPFQPNATGSKVVKIPRYIIESAPEIECPPNDLPHQGLVIGMMLYDDLADIVPRVSLEDPTKFSSLLQSELSKSMRRNCPDGAPAICHPPNLSSGELRCVAADYIRANLNALDHRAPLKWKPIDQYLTLRTTGRELRYCNLLVEPGDATNSRSDEVRSFPNRLRTALNEGTEVFAYGLSPKNFVQRVSTTLDSRDSARLSVHLNKVATDKDRAAVLQSLSETSDRVRAIQNTAIIVGFGSERTVQELDAAQSDEWKTTEFGWAIAPRLKSASRREHVDGQYPLAAIISVPSWWRSILIRIETCWLSRKDFVKSPTANDLRVVCREKGKEQNHIVSKKEEVIRLPGAIAELSQKLGFEVIQQPHLKAQETPPQILRVGWKGELVLLGGRLWRSTEVTVGAQSADEIVVLPNMEGIIARFSCVRSQAYYDKDYSVEQAVPPPSADVATGTVKQASKRAVGKDHRLKNKNQPPLDQSRPGEAGKTPAKNKLQDSSPTEALPHPQSEKQPSWGKWVKTKAKVWTSEGVTDSIDVLLYDPQKSLREANDLKIEDFRRRGPCPDPPSREQTFATPDMPTRANEVTERPPIKATVPAAPALSASPAASP